MQVSWDSVYTLCRSQHKSEYFHFALFLLLYRYYISKVTLHIYEQHYIQKLLEELVTKYILNTSQFSGVDMYNIEDTI